VTLEEPATAPFTLPYGLKNVGTTYASSTSTSLSAYTDLSSYHLRSSLDLISTPPVSAYPEEISSDEGAWDGADFSRLDDMETLLRFLEASDYCFGYSDSDGANFDPFWECFHLEANAVAPVGQGGTRLPEPRGTTPHTMRSLWVITSRRELPR